MPKIATECKIAEPRDYLTQTDLASITVLPTQAAPVITSIAADAVATSLTYVGLEAFIVSSSLQGDTVTDLLTELLTDPIINQRVRIKIQVETERCITPQLSLFGEGGTPISDFQDLWNRNGENCRERLDGVRDPIGGFGLLLSPAQNDLIRNWQSQMRNVYNCIEILVEENVRCSNPPPPRCRVPTIVEDCLVRQILPDPE